MKYLSITAIFYYRWQNVWYTFRSIMTNLAMQDDLDSLIQWAGKKNLKKVQQAYIRKYHYLEERLWMYQVHNRGLVILCEFLLTAYKQVIPTKNYYKKGSGSKYRSSYTAYN